MSEDPIRYGRLSDDQLAGELGWRAEDAARPGNETSRFIVRALDELRTWRAFAALLPALEWGNQARDTSSCPICGGAKPGDEMASAGDHGHRPGCDLAAALEGLGLGRGE